MGKYKKITDFPTALEILLKMAAFVPPGEVLRNSEMLLQDSFSDGKNTPINLEYFGAYLHPHTFLSHNLSPEEEKELDEKEKKVLKLIDKEIERFPLLYAYIYKDTSIAVVTNEDGSEEIFPSTSKKQRIELYNGFIFLRKYLTSIAAYCTLQTSDNLLPEIRDLLNEQSEFNYRFLISPQITKKTIHFKESHIIRALDGINPKRLKMCPICKVVFWAKKINSKTCGKQVCIDGLQNCKKKCKTKKEEKTNNSTKKEEKTNNSFEISDQRQAERKEFLSKDFSKTE